VDRAGAGGGGGGVRGPELGRAARLTAGRPGHRHSNAVRRCSAIRSVVAYRR
jgi:hypothetical protein